LKFLLYLCCAWRRIFIRKDRKNWAAKEHMSKSRPSWKERERNKDAYGTLAVGATQDAYAGVFNTKHRERKCGSWIKDRSSVLEGGKGYFSLS
jgi:hypothetical protein